MGIQQWQWQSKFIHCILMGVFTLSYGNGNGKPYGMYLAIFLSVDVGVTKWVYNPFHDETFAIAIAVAVTVPPPPRVNIPIRMH